MATNKPLETSPTARGVFWASSDPDLAGWVLTWQNVSLPVNRNYRIWIGSKMVDGVVDGFRELTIQSFKEGYWNIEDDEVRARLQLLRVNEIEGVDEGPEINLTSDLFRNLKIGEIMEVHSRAIASALSEDSNKGENNKIRLYKPSIVRYSYLRFPESVLPKAMVSEIKYGAKNALLLAKVYCWLAETGETKLAKRTASLLGVDVAIVHSAVKTARKNGWMTKSHQGKSGGTFTADGEASFKSYELSKLYEQIVSNSGGKK